LSKKGADYFAEYYEHINELHAMHAISRQPTTTACKTLQFAKRQHGHTFLYADLISASEASRPTPMTS
jgi:hypothetical protein